MFKKIIKAKALWVLVFLAVVGAVGYVGYNQYQADQIAAVKQAESHITTVTEANIDTVMGTKKSLLLVICAPDVCEMQRAQLEKYAAANTATVDVGTIDIKAQPKVASFVISQAMQAAGKGFPVAFPLYILITDKGNLAVGMGMQSAETITGFVTQASAATPDQAAPAK